MEVALLKQITYEKCVTVLVFQVKLYIVLLQITNSEKIM